MSQSHGCAFMATEWRAMSAAERSKLLEELLAVVLPEDPEFWGHKTIAELAAMSDWKHLPSDLMDLLRHCFAEAEGFSVDRFVEKRDAAESPK